MYTVLIHSYSAVVLLHVASPFLLCVIESVCVCFGARVIDLVMLHMLCKCQQLQ